MHEQINKILLWIGGVSTSASLVDLDLKLSVIVRATAIITFFCYLLINQDSIVEGFKKFIRRFKSK